MMSAARVERSGDHYYIIRLPDGRSAIVSNDEAWALLDSLRKVLGEDLGAKVRASTHPKKESG